MNKSRMLVVGLAISMGWTALSFAADREIHRTFQLSPGAEVSIGGINGWLRIETTSGATADVIIRRRAHSDGDFENRPVNLELVGNRLVLEIRDQGRSRRAVRDEVEMILPSSVSRLSIQGVNGRVQSGFVEGETKVSGVNGPVRLAQAAGRLEMSGINGSIEVELGEPREGGVRLHGINGSIRLLVPSGSNFEVEVSNKNGKVALNLPNAEIQENERGRFRARVGSGGALIEIEGINGRVDISPQKR